MITAKELAQYIISTIKERMSDITPEEFDVTPLKLQKLLYYCQGYSLALTGKPAFPETIEAWAYGPVVDSVYQEYKKYSGGIIPYNDIKVANKPSEAVQSVVDLVLADKGQYSGEALARMTHKESPWRDTYGGLYTNFEISCNKMRDYFSNELLRREEDYDDRDEAWENLGEPVSISELEAALEEI